MLIFVIMNIKREERENNMEINWRILYKYDLGIQDGFCPTEEREHEILIENFIVPELETQCILENLKTINRDKKDINIIEKSDTDANKYHLWFKNQEYVEVTLIPLLKVHGRYFELKEAIF